MDKLLLKIENVDYWLINPTDFVIPKAREMYRKGIIRPGGMEKGWVAASYKAVKRYVDTNHLHLIRVDDEEALREMRVVVRNTSIGVTVQHLTEATGQIEEVIKSLIEMFEDADDPDKFSLALQMKASFNEALALIENKRRPHDYDAIDEAVLMEAEYYLDNADRILRKLSQDSSTIEAEVGADNLTKEEVFVASYEAHD